MVAAHRIIAFTMTRLLRRVGMVRGERDESSHGELDCLAGYFYETGDDLFGDGGVHQNELLPTHYEDILSIQFSNHLHSHQY